MDLADFISRIRAECAGQPFDLRQHVGDILETRLTFVSRGKSIDDPTARCCDLAVSIESIELSKFDLANQTVSAVAAKWKSISRRP